MTQFVIRPSRVKSFEVLEIWFQTHEFQFGAWFEKRKIGSTQLDFHDFSLHGAPNSQTQLNLEGRWLAESVDSG